MTIFFCTFVPIEVKNIPAFLSECIISITNYTNGLLFSSYATATSVTVDLYLSDNNIFLVREIIPESSRGFILGGLS